MLKKETEQSWQLEMKHTFVKNVLVDVVVADHVVVVAVHAVVVVDAVVDVVVDVVVVVANRKYSISYIKM